MRPGGVRLVPVGDVSTLTDAIVEQLALPPKARVSAGAADPAIGEENLGATLLLYREVLR
jgi:hypothetical protein